MERVLFLTLEAAGCEAEAVLNGVPVARVQAPSAAVPAHAAIAVHEYTLAGPNRLSLVIQPPPIGAAPRAPQPCVATVPSWARLRLLLPRQGQAAHEDAARLLARVDWAVPEGEVFEAPWTVHQPVDLPVTFPRWRWLDAPVIELNPALRSQVLAFVQRIAIDLSRGDPESLLHAWRLRLEELAQAYQRDPAAEALRVREQVRQLHGLKALRLPIPTADTLVLRPLAEGRLLDCVDAAGHPILRTAPSPQGAVHAWPLRLAVVEGRPYALR